MKIKDFRFVGKFPNYEVHTILDDGQEKTHEIDIGNLEYVGTLDEKQLKSLIKETVKAHQEPKRTEAMNQLIGKSL
ncbi:MAG: hypothetical protein C7B44_00615 [Sulfobacillus thermosulfidooxidans]|uniref:Uncharacterized protein n=1 Tax=Sulfobacillus thermotolerans TaxID=338644 RepID=A0ABM6RT90_9FIRM|nr:hypothetical protein [Sulfobacillus sp. hq2]AUW94678.1 hypothetical protein BXT84_12585 [Sulfobacillus thermotolerans]MCY0908114.1 hypothetical protein [Sulfobacillus thermotolerans]POB11453.1 hypothetical protein CO251_04730 [Sulfobacillus sp. hq2]PSR38062.1 MAG: hypothetical protein C7B44_00615 [Sulfobacillus thermosulfidooxidans]